MQITHFTNPPTLDSSLTTPTTPISPIYPHSLLLLPAPMPVLFGHTQRISQQRQ
jgi:hypothetical protein